MHHPWVGTELSFEKPSSGSLLGKWRRVAGECQVMNKVKQMCRDVGSLPGRRCLQCDAAFLCYEEIPESVVFLWRKDLPWLTVSEAPVLVPSTWGFCGETEHRGRKYAPERSSLPHRSQKGKQEGREGTKDKIELPRTHPPSTRPHLQIFNYFTIDHQIRNQSMG